MKNLWQKTSSIDPQIESFTAGDDWQYDNHILYFDCVGSIAHADMLCKIGVLSNQEYALLKDALRKIINDYHAGTFRVTAEYEDCHTAIESRLVEQCGAVGKKIHSGRSRNDQVFCALLMYGRDRLFAIVDRAYALAQSCCIRAQQEEHTEMMGRTHLQNAMPSTVGVWAAAYAEQIDILSDAYEALYRIGNRSPLGSAAGYGVPLPLDRVYTAHLLAFDDPYQIVLAAANSRGHWEAYYLDTIAQIMMIVSRIAIDLLLFTLPEIGYMHLPKNLCTGSSIMPHKHNPDVLELMRAKAAAVIGSSAQIKQIMHALPAGYNRDLQEAKRILIEGICTTENTLAAAQLVIDSLEIDRDRLRTAIDPQIFSVDAALQLVQKEGVSFRDAYHKISATSTIAPSDDYATLISARSSFGAPGNLQIPKLIDRISAHQTHWQKRHTRITSHLQEMVSCIAI